MSKRLYLFIAPLLLSLCVISHAFALESKPFPQGIKPMPMCIVDSFANYLVLNSSQGVVFFNRNDESLRTVSLSPKYEKYVSSLMYYGKTANGNVELVIFDEKKYVKITVDAGLNVISEESLTELLSSTDVSTDDENKSWTMADAKAWMKEGVNTWKAYRIYSEDRTYYVQFTEKYYKKDKKTGDTKVYYSLTLHRTDTKEQLAAYEKTWHVFTAKNQFFPSFRYQHDVKVSNSGKVIDIIAYDIVRANEKGGFFTAKTFEDRGRSHILVVNMEPGKSAKELELGEIADEDLISTIKILRADNEKALIAGWYRNVEEEKKYLGVYSMIINMKDAKIESYNKLAKEVNHVIQGVAISSHVANGRNKDDAWYKFDEGYRHVGLGNKSFPVDVFVDNEGQISDLGFNVYTKSLSSDDKWIDAHTPNIEKVTIPLGYNSAAKAYNFVVIDCGLALRDGNGVYYKSIQDDNGVYFLSVSKDGYLRTHLTPWLNLHSFQRIYRTKNGHLARIPNVLVDYSLMPVSPEKIILFVVMYGKSDAEGRYACLELTVPNISQLPVDDNIEVKEPLKKVSGAGL